MTLTPGTLIILPLPASSLTWRIVCRRGAQVELRSPFKEQTERYPYSQVQEWIAQGAVQVRWGIR